jgi:hypothetical protein
MDACRKDAPLFNEMAIEWKLWLINEEEGLIGGIYYFDDEEAYKKTEKSKRNESYLLPLIENVFSKTFEVNKELSKVNKAPI